LLFSSLTIHAAQAAENGCNIKSAPEWPKTADIIPVSQHSPDGVTVDILNLPFGISLDDACSEMMEHTNGKVETIEMSLKSSKKIPLKFTYAIESQRSINDSESSYNEEDIFLRFSSPSSGSQLYHITRYIKFDDPVKQPLVSDLIGQLSERFGTEPFKKNYAVTSEDSWFWVLNESGAPYDSKKKRHYKACEALSSIRPNEYNLVNPERECDISAQVRIFFGRTKEYAKAVQISISDLQRFRENSYNDLVGVEVYSNDIDFKQQTKTGGKAPKL